MPRKSNLISTGNYALAKNIEKVKTKGIELDIVFNKQFNKHVNLFSTAGFTWLDSDNNNNTPSFYISSHAKYLFNFSETISIHQFSFSMTGLYKKRSEKKAASIGAEVTPSYFILNTKAAYRFMENKASVFLLADNIFNKKYSDILGASMPGSWISGGFEFSL
jgi:iron complex outermembrane receptor protein